MKKYLQDLIEKKEKRSKELRESIEAASTADEVRSLGDALSEVETEIKEAKEQLRSIEEAEINGGNGSPLNPGEQRGFNPLATFAQGTHEPRGESGPYATMEYREAFMTYVQNGTPIPTELRAGGDSGITVASDIGAIIPEPIMNEFIKEVTKVYGHIYSKVRKMNVQGGIEFPISKLKANFKWISETKVSDKQKAGNIKDFITFNYHIGEIRVAQSLLSQVVSLTLFEAEITQIMVAAYLEAMDKAIVYGTGVNQPLGITKDTRITNVVEMTDEEFGDWTAWRKKLFAKVPLSKRGQGEFLFPASTVESYLLTMKDSNNRPLFKEATDLSMGNTAGSFFGRTTDLVEPDVIADFDTAEAGDIVGIFWVPNDYAINTNMQFGMKRYFDDDNNEWINKGLTIVDGKILDTSGCFLIKKVGTDITNAETARAAKASK